MSARHLYVHVPFCARRCTYCDFSIAVRRHVPVAEYLDALAREVALADVSGPPVTLYLGGGTPSRLGAAGIAAVAWMVHAGRGVEEFTVEANPEDVSRESARAWLESGVNRLSIGAQSFDQRVLAWMHRTHDAAAIGRAVCAARAAGITNLSLDLIFALPEALGRDWSRDLDAALALEPDHISLYGLTVEHGTALARQIAREELRAAPESRWEEEYLDAHRRLAAAGFVFYELSNAARPGREAKHNRAYWQLVPYLGLGPAAHSFDGTSRWWNESAYARWIALLREGTSPVAGREILADAQQRLERIYLGLRTSTGVSLDASSPPGLKKVAELWVRQGWAVLTAGPAERLSLTPQGWLRLDELVATV